LRLHEAADGGLARIRLPGGRIDARGLRGVADVAALGNGVIELTSRASLQVRGLDPKAGEECAAILTAVELLPSTTHERVRNILASPVAGRHPLSLAATDDLVRELDETIREQPELATLSGRFLFGVDDGAHLLGERVPDVTLSASAADTFTLVVRGISSGRTVARANAGRLAVDAAQALMRADPPETPRAHQIAARTLGLGRFEQSNGRVAITVLPRLGRLDIPASRRLASLADELRTDVRLATQRTLTLPDVDHAAVSAAERELRALGLIDDPASGWHGLSACSGLGACARARHDVRAEAGRRAAERHPGDPLEHWAACERRCGRPSGAHIAYTTIAAGIEREVVK
jgi:sulfite reductase beta subunit-like hemoprotein